jgi:GNAT superfamily N-acetyltransferase
LIKIREASEKDSEALIELQNRCPQGTSFVLGVDSSPDYFARSKPFKDWHVLVAYDDEGIVGSGAFAINEVYVGGRKFRVAYEYGFIVDPRHRRKGIAIKLQEHIERVALEKGVDLLHLDITEDNGPSIRLFSRLGFRKVKDCATFSLISRRQKVPQERNIRQMERSDVEEVVDLINEMYHNYSFFNPFKPEDFVSYVRRMPYFNFQDILVFEDNGNIKACLGCWNYNKVRKYIVQKFSWRLKTQIYLLRLVGLFTQMPEMPKIGEPLSSYNLTNLAYKNQESITELVKHVINKALDNKINFLHVPVDLDTEIAAVLSKFRHTRLKLHFFVKSLKQAKAPDLEDAKLYIDASEL